MTQRRILGIDPGSRHTGFAILVEENRVFRAVVCDVINTAGIDDQIGRLQQIYRSVSDILKEHNPTHCAVETPVYGVDPLAMLKLGRAQAAALLAISGSDLPVAEYYPKAVKKAVTGNGNANKKQVAYMLEKLISLPKNKITTDASDALAVAWCHHLNLDKPAGAAGEKKYHQNNSKSSWSSFVEENPGRIRS